MPIPTEEERLSTTLGGRYRLERILGRGGMGVVYEAKHTYTGRAVAVKLLRPEVRPDGSQAKRLEREARAAAALEHPSIVDVLDMGEADGCLFLVLELLEGQSLSRVLRDRGSLSESEVVALGLQLADALASAHGVGVVHRDVTPRNVVMARRGDSIVPTLIDFGLAKVDDGEAVTTTGAVMGTPWYMSPEQAAGTGEVGPETDVWALGAVLHECLTGVRPFDGPSTTAVLMNVLRGRSPALDALPREGLGAVLRDVLTQGARRIETARELSERLGALATSEEPAARKRPSSRVAIGFAALSVGVAAVAVASHWPPESSTSEPTETPAVADAPTHVDAGSHARQDAGVERSAPPALELLDAGPRATPPRARVSRPDPRVRPPHEEVETGAGEDAESEGQPGLRTRW